MRGDEASVAAHEPDYAHAIWRAARLHLSACKLKRVLGFGWRRRGGGGGGAVAHRTAFTASETAVSKPKERSMTGKSLSIVLGTHATLNKTNKENERVI
jgi:hypothetical protein